MTEVVNRTWCVVCNCDAWKCPVRIAPRVRLETAAFVGLFPASTVLFLRTRGTDGRFARHAQSPIHVDSRVTQGLEAPSRTVHVAPGYGPWKQTSSRSITVWTQPGDSLRTEDDRSNSWKRLRSSQGHARDDDDDEYTTDRISVYMMTELVGAYASIMLPLSLLYTKLGKFTDWSLSWYSNCRNSGKRWEALCCTRSSLSMSFLNDTDHVVLSSSC